MGYVVHTAMQVIEQIFHVYQNVMRLLVLYIFASLG